jgi:DNA-binding response OmpR family regulator
MDKRFRVLAVDDEAVNTQLIKSVLRDEYDVLTATSGREAIELLKQYKPDLILLDVLMPDLDGFEVCRMIKADAAYAGMPVIFLTALDTQAGEMQGLELGGIDYVAKPFNFPLLKLRVRNHLLLKEQRDLLASQKAALEAALARVKQLEGIIPICAYCKKIRDDKQSWHQLEIYISDHSEALFSHGACPDCLKEQMKIMQKN